MLVNERPEGAMHLPVDEPARTIQFDDFRGHREPHSEVPRSPRDRLVQVDLATGGARNRLLIGTCHRCQVRVDAERQIEKIFGRMLRAGRDRECGWHDSIIAARVSQAANRAFAYIVFAAAASVRFLLDPPANPSIATVADDYAPVKTTREGVDDARALGLLKVRDVEATRPTA